MVVVGDEVRLEVELMERWSLLKGIRRNHEHAWDEIMALMQPFRGDVTTIRSEGSSRISAVFDSTAMQAADTFVNFLKGAIIPAGSDWVRLRAKPPFDRDLRIKELLDSASNRILSALSASNFYVESAAFLKDFGVLGNATLLVEEDAPYANGEFRGLTFEAVPIGRMWWMNGKKRRPFIHVREFELPAIDCRRFFAGLDETCKSAEDAIKRGKPMEPVCIAHFVWQNEKGRRGGLVAPSDRPWQSAYIDVKERKAIGEAGGFSYNPYVVSRWMTVDGEEYGRGRGHLARPDAKGVNELRAQIYLATARNLDPLLGAEDDAIIEGDMAPGGQVFFRPFQRMKPEFMQSGADIETADEIANRDRQQILRAFLGDIFEDPETQPRSAEESRQRLIRQQQRLAAPAEAVDYEFATPLIECVAGKMHEAGALPEFNELADFGGAEIEIVFQSPFFTSQKNSQVQRVYSFITRQVGMSQATQDPGWLDRIDPDKVSALDAELSDVPAEIMRTDEEIEQRRMARATRAAQERLIAAQGGKPTGRPPNQRNPIPAAQVEELA